MMARHTDMAVNAGLESSPGVDSSFFGLDQILTPVLAFAATISRIGSWVRRLHFRRDPGKRLAAS